MQVVLRPELRTAGGESLGIFLSHRWIGDVYLVYREGHLLTGTIQLDSGKLPDDQVDAVVSHIQDYVAGLAGALDINDATVVMMYGDIDPVLEGPATWTGHREENEAQHDSAQDTSGANRKEARKAPEGEILNGSAPEDQDEQYGDEGPEYDLDGFQTSSRRGISADPSTESNKESAKNRLSANDRSPKRRRRNRGRRQTLHLSLYKEEGSHTKYHLHNGHHEPIGLVAVDELDNSVTGRVEFWQPPGKAMTNQVARLLAREFADGDVQRVSFTMNYMDEHLGDMHLEKQPLH
ncbi:MAG TPA: hypothetical protein GX517_10540 [Alicyclobacillus sp.]|nr:hypothetical protein [Alicyclobacillus sp.]